MQTISLNRVDIEAIQKYLDEDVDIQFFTIIKSGEESGIGYNIEVEHTEIINNRPATIRVEVSGVENW